MTARVPVVLGRDDRYFTDRHQGLPRDGYAALFARLLDHPNIEVHTGVDHAESSDGRANAFEGTVYTGGLDTYFGGELGPLPYRSIDFDVHHHDVDSFQAVGQVNTPTVPGQTRVIEFKKLTDQAVRGTTVSHERPCAHRPGVNEPYYPVPYAASRALHDRYVALAERRAPSVVFAGRLADYRYYNMDQTVGHALRVFDRRIAADAPGIRPR